MTLGPLDEYQQLLVQIAETYSQGRTQAMQVVNTQLVATYW